MESRIIAPRRWVAASLVLLAAASLAGCTNMLFTAAYLIRGTDTPAECNKLKDKKVVVVCRPVVALQYRDARVDQDLAQQVGALLQKKVSKIKVIQHRKVAEWMDEHSWEEYVQVGAALNADVVVGIDLERFELRPSQTLYQGKANADIKVIDCKTKDIIFQKRLPELAYPPNRPVQASEMPEQQFRRAFVTILADQIGRIFYPFDPHEDFALDSKIIE